MILIFPTFSSLPRCSLPKWRAIPNGHSETPPDQTRLPPPSSTTMPTPLPFILLFLLLPSAAPDPSPELSALLALRSSAGRRLRWDPSSPFCQWRGVKCDHTNSTVTALRLPGSRLIGPIPVGFFPNLTSLNTLSLRFNALSGPLPADISSSPLQNLFLRRNRLSGNLLPLISLRSLARLDIADNAFSGAIPAGLGSLRHLVVLSLENNNLTGQLPDLDLPKLVSFNVSFNNLNGSVPPKLRRMPANAFLGMHLCGGPFPSCEVSPPTPTPGSAPVGPPPNDVGHRRRHRLTGAQIVGIVVACIVGSIMLLFIILALCRRCGRGKKATIDDSASKYDPEPVEVKDPKPITEMAPAAAVPSPAAVSVVAAAEVAATTGTRRKLVFFRAEKDKVFDLEDLLRASAEVLGKGTFGTTYKVLLETGAVVAVKRLKEVELPMREFVEKVEAVGRMEHPNVVSLKAYYYCKDEKLLVFQYMQMGSLSAFLHGSRGSRQPITWETRLNIAIAAGRGIEYIHSTSPTASHGNIRSSNILLHKSSHARVSDHALAQLASPASVTNRANGYCAPEVTEPRRVSQKADVYSFGIVLLELLTGKVPVQSLGNDDGFDLPRWVKEFVRHEWSSKVFDSELAMDLVVHEYQMVELLQLGLDCAAQVPDFRPSMAKVVVKMEEIYRASLDQAKAEDGSLPPSPRSLMD